MINKKIRLGVKLLLLALLIASGLCTESQAALSATFLGYYIPISYSSSSKTDTNVIGTYGFLGLGLEHSLEFEYDSVNKQSDNSPTQQDVLGIYTYYGLPYTKLKAGYHHVHGIETGEDAGVYIMGGSFDEVNYYGAKTFTVGTDVYYSDYSSGRKVTQITPFVTAYFQPYWPLFGYYELSTKANFIENSETSSMIKGAETTLKYTSYPWAITGQLWSGEAEYGVFSGGNVVYNTADLMRDGYGISVAYSFSPKTSFILGYSYQYLIASGDTDTTTVGKVQGMFSLTL